MMPAGGARVLVACSHGTASPDGRATVAALAAAVAAARPGLTVRQAFVDVQEPSVAAVVGGLAAEGRRCVVVPVLLSTGYHVRVDIAAAVAAADGWAVAAEHLGVTGCLAPLVAARLAQAGVGEDDAVVLAAAGSSDPAAGDDVRAVAVRLAAGRVAPVRTGVLSVAGEVAAAVAAARAAGARRVAVATYLLAEGVFARRLGEVGADVVSAPLGEGAPAELVARVLACYDAAAESQGAEGADAADAAGGMADQPKRPPP